MLIRKAALFSVLMLYGAPALADSLKPVRQSKPKAIAAFDVADQPVELLAVTRRARADTDFHRQYIDDCETMAKVYPGYPQPALLSVDVRFRFQAAAQTARISRRLRGSPTR